MTGREWRMVFLGSWSTWSKMGKWGKARRGRCCTRKVTWIPAKTWTWRTRTFFLAAVVVSWTRKTTRTSERETFLHPFPYPFQFHSYPYHPWHSSPCPSHRRGLQQQQHCRGKERAAGREGRPKRNVEEASCS